MSMTVVGALPSAKGAMEKLALAEAEKAREEARHKEKAEAEKKATGTAQPTVENPVAATVS